MKQLLLLAFIFISSTASAVSQSIPVLTIRQIQEVPQDSLVAADNAGLSSATTLDNSPYLKDTVSVWGVVMSKVRLWNGGPLGIPSLSNAYVFYIADTAAKGAWQGIHIRASDTVAAVTSLVAVLDTGMVVKVTGRVQEFDPSVRTGVPANNFSSTTQFEMDLDPGPGTNFTPVEINPVRMKRRPMPTVVPISDLFVGSTPKFATGEKWEGCYIEVRNVTVVQSTISGNRMTMVVQDASGNQLTVLDDAYYYRTDMSGYQPAAQGSKLEYVRGFIANRNGIAPMYPNDIKIASYPPTVSTVRRTPIVPKPADDVIVTAKVTDTNTGGTVTKAELWWGLNGGPLEVLPMTLAKPDSAVGTIPSQQLGWSVRYAVVATDNDNETGRAPGDTTREFYNYVVTTGNLTIHDVQYTPYKSGNSPFSGARASLRGVVTADTSNLGATFLYIQDGVQPWSGIQVEATRDSMKMLRMGDDVTITGTIGESYNVTRLANIVGIVKNGTAPVPAAVLHPTGDFKTNPGGKTDGDAGAEPWESMLVTFQNLTVTQQNADGASGNFGEFAVTDGTGDLRVDDVGTWKRLYGNGLAGHGPILLAPGTKIASLTGIMYFSFSNYKLEPRGTDDFAGVQTAVERIGDGAADFRLHQNYPNPFNPTTTIQYDVPAAMHVRLQVFDALGREVALLVSERMDAGSYAAHFDGSRLASGLYCYRLTAGAAQLSGKMILAK